MITNMGPNDLKNVVWSLGELFIYIYFVAFNYFLFFCLLMPCSDYIRDVGAGNDEDRPK